MVHCVHAVGGDVHLVERAIAIAKRVNTLHGNTAQRQVLSKLRIIHRQSRQVSAKPFGKNFHECPTGAELALLAVLAELDPRSARGRFIEVIKPLMMRASSVACSM